MSARLNLAALEIREPVHVADGRYAPGDESDLAEILDRKTAEDLVGLGVLAPGVLQDPDEVEATLVERARQEAAAKEAAEAAEAEAPVVTKPATRSKRTRRR